MRKYGTYIFALFIFLAFFGWRANFLEGLAFKLTPSSVNSGSNYISAETRVLNIQNTPHSTVHLNFKFKADKIEGFPNLFQTAILNEGIRAELANKDFGLIYASNPIGDPAGIILDTNFDYDRYHSLDVIATPNGSVRVTYDGVRMSPEPILFRNFQVTDLKVGQGFNSDRIFNGIIKSWTIESYSSTTLDRIYLVLFISCIFMLMIVYFFIRRVED